MTHAQNPSNTPSNAITADADAEAYKQVQHYGRALIKVRTELADMWLEDSEAGRALIEEPFTGSFSWGAFLIEDCLKDEDRELAKKLLWWHARVATGKFLPPEITKMILGALKDPQSDSNSDSDSDSG